MLDLPAEQSMEAGVVRPLMVCGSGVKAGFLNTMKFLSKKIPLPLPFGSVSISEERWQMRQEEKLFLSRFPKEY